jgi:hypothetical protein
MYTEITDDGLTRLNAECDPARPSAWRAPAIRTFLKNVAAQLGTAGLVHIHTPKERFWIQPDGRTWAWDIAKETSNREIHVKDLREVKT